MQVSKWGNSLAVRLPAAVVKTLELKEGDEIEINVAGDRTFEISRDPRRLEALEMIRQLDFPARYAGPNSRRRSRAPFTRLAPQV